jgi:catalase (peroxidase I)
MVETQQDEARQAIWALYKMTPCMPLMLRFAFHDAGTFNPMNDKTTGANGSIMTKEEIERDENKGLDFAKL